MITTLNMYKLVALICIVILGTLAVLFYVSPLQTASQTKKSTEIAKDASVSAQTRLFFNPSYLKLTSTETRDIPLFVQTGENSINQAQFELRYNPTTITVTSIRPGTFFGNPLILLQEIDAIHGRIQFALKNNGEENQKGTGPLAILSITRNIEASGSGKALVEFLSKSAVRGTNGRGSLLQSTENLVIEYQSPFTQF